jgi:hypothetical protein
LVVGTNNHVYTIWQNSAGGQWSGWIELGGVAISHVYYGNNTSTTISIRVAGTTGAWYYNHWNAFLGWSGWTLSDGGVTSWFWG